MGRFGEAVEGAELAAGLSKAAGNKGRAKVTEGALRLFKAGKPYRMGK